MPGPFKVELSDDGGATWRRRSAHKDEADARTQIGRMARKELRPLRWRIVHNGEAILDLDAAEAKALASKR